jgi:hypothetical protein
MVMNPTKSVDEMAHVLEREKMEVVALWHSNLKRNGMLVAMITMQKAEEAEKIFHN